MEQFANLFRQINHNFIAGSFISIFVIILTRGVFKKKVQTQTAVAIFKWLLVSYAGLCVIVYLAEFAVAWYSGTEYMQYSISDRLNGPYAAIYWFILIAQMVLPFILLIKKAGANVYCVFTVALLTNIRWVMNSIVLHTSQRDYIPAPHPYMPFPGEMETIIIGIFNGIAAILISHFLSSRKQKVVASS